MKHLTLLLAGSLALACSHGNERPAASSDSVDAATSTPSNNPDFTPPQNQTGTSTGTGTTGSDGTTGTGDVGSGSNSMGSGSSPSTSGSGSGSGSSGAH